MTTTPFTLFFAVTRDFPLATQKFTTSSIANLRIRSFFLRVWICQKKDWVSTENRPLDVVESESEDSLPIVRDWENPKVALTGFPDSHQNNEQE